MAAALPNRDAPLQQKTADLVHQCRTAHHPALPYPVQRLHVQLFFALDRHKTHPGPIHSLGDRFGIDVVVLVGLHIRLHVLRRHQPYIMTLLAKRTAKEVRSSAGFHANQIDLQVRCESKQLNTRELLPHHHLAGHAQTYKMKY